MSCCLSGETEMPLAAPAGADDSIAIPGRPVATFIFSSWCACRGASIASVRYQSPSIASG